MELISLEFKEVCKGKVINKTVEFSELLLEKPYNKSSLTIVKIEGESMQPMIKNGALLVVDISQKVIINDGIYLINHGSNMWVKQARVTEEGSTLFVSVNSAYKDRYFKQEDVHLIGKVLLTFTNL